MLRLCTAVGIAVAAVVTAAEPAASADAQYEQKAAARAQQKHGPARRHRPIVRDRSLYGPPLPPSSTERNYYGPAPGIQPPMERVPLPAPLAPPPIR